MKFTGSKEDIYVQGLTDGLEVARLIAENYVDDPKHWMIARWIIAEFSSGYAFRNRHRIAADLPEFARLINDRLTEGGNSKKPQWPVYCAHNEVKWTTAHLVVVDNRSDKTGLTAEHSSDTPPTSA